MIPASKSRGSVFKAESSIGRLAKEEFFMLNKASLVQLGQRGSNMGWLNTKYLPNFSMIEGGAVLLRRYVHKFEKF